MSGTDDDYVELFGERQGNKIPTAEAAVAILASGTEKPLTAKGAKDAKKGSRTAQLGWADDDYVELFGERQGKRNPHG